MRRAPRCSPRRKPLGRVNPQTGGLAWGPHAAMPVRASRMTADRLSPCRSAHASSAASSWEVSRTATTCEESAPRPGRLRGLCPIAPGRLFVPIAYGSFRLANLSSVLGRKRALSTSGCLSLGPAGCASHRVGHGPNRARTRSDHTSGSQDPSQAHGQDPCTLLPRRRRRRPQTPRRPGHRGDRQVPSHGGSLSHRDRLRARSVLALRWRPAHTAGAHPVEDHGGLAEVQGSARGRGPAQGQELRRRRDAAQGSR